MTCLNTLACVEKLHPSLADCIQIQGEAYVRPDCSFPEDRSQPGRLRR